MSQRVSNQQPFRVNRTKSFWITKTTTTRSPLLPPTIADVNKKTNIKTEDKKKNHRRYNTTPAAAKQPLAITHREQ